MTDWTTTSELAYENGRRAGFAEGLEAAGIAPVQWRDAEDLPVPEKGDVILWLRGDDFRAGTFARSDHHGCRHLIVDGYGGAVWIAETDIRAWCPVQAFRPKEQEATE